MHGRDNLEGDPVRMEDEETMNEHIRWAVERWNAEVKNRPLQNIHRRSLDTTWRQVIRHYGGDDEGLCGPPHDELVAIAANGQLARSEKDGTA